MCVILQLALPRHLALFSLVFTYSVSLNHITILSGPYHSKLFYVTSCFPLIFKLLGFILWVMGLHGLYFSNSWFFQVYVSGCGMFLELL